MKKNKLFAITTGDAKGIGLEVTVKALLKFKTPKNSNFVIYTSKKNQIQLFNKLDKLYSLKFFESENIFLDHLKYPIIINSKRPLLYIVFSSHRPAAWVESAAKLCMSNVYSGMITAPLSKQETFKLGHHELGHTEILKRVSGVKNLFMFFRGKYFNTLLVTGHIPVSSISKSVSIQLSAAAEEALRLVGTMMDMRPIAVLGLNPHAGDKGLIGKEELRINSILSKTTNPRKFSRTLVPDVAFQKSNWKKYSLYLSMYHDQGLIPFKMIHGFKATHITLGLPFIRTSVDHGTGFDIYGKNIADPTSMIYAIKSCIQLSSKKG